MKLQEKSNQISLMIKESHFESISRYNFWKNKFT